MTDVRVGIVSWNTAALLDRCLAALPAALGSLDAEIVVVDNASDDGSADRAAEHAGVVVHRNDENVGYARAMNQALAGTDAPVLVALNPDAGPGPGSVAALVERLRARPRAAIVAPRLVEPDGRLQHSVHRFPSLRLAAAANLVPTPLLRGALGRRLWFEGAADHRRSGPIDWAIGAVHVLRAEATGTRPYSERWFMYAEDLDLCWRVHRAGWDVELDADVEVVHVGNASGAQRWGGERAARYWVASYDWYAAATSPGRARAYAALNLAGSVLKGTWARARGRAWGRELLAVAPVHARAVVQPCRQAGT
jgi:GT2 family glycosyltransferase